MAKTARQKAPGEGAPRAGYSAHYQARANTGPSAARPTTLECAYTVADGSHGQIPLGPHRRGYGSDRL
jgi:hypothetical protein